ncbi:hypothetical protein [Magnetospirillum sp. SS-4]|uniref:hypothetical protein n=1 Tax=Magnetospirillum sp. SS-4 TaxID=2681465 RepID=UPI00137FB3D3|nr:hypothetical protein [Magnetospirillum sp. SS-4]CAA7621980.1 hypothetical protein MTBSS4_310038 [Magnetospirillum sp. SS-4]
MESFTICWQSRPGGRVESFGPLPRDLAEFRLREHNASYPHIRAWLTQPSIQIRECETVL